MECTLTDSNRYGSGGSPDNEDYSCSTSGDLPVSVGRNAVAVSYRGLLLHLSFRYRYVNAYSLSSGLIRNPNSVRVSVPSYVVPGAAAPDDKQRWRIDLVATEPYWQGVWISLLLPGHPGSYVLGLVSCCPVVLGGPCRSSSPLLVDWPPENERRDARRTA
jgi:hypothetical protein